VRIEAENFAALEGFKLEDTNDRAASHRLQVARAGDGAAGRIRTRFDQPYIARRGRYDVEVRYLGEPGKPSRFKLSKGGAAVGEADEPASDEKGWRSLTFKDVEIQAGDELAVEVRGLARLDYVELVRREGDGARDAN
jgi:hypothetical protein